MIILQIISKKDEIISKRMKSSQKGCNHLKKDEICTFKSESTSRNLMQLCLQFILAAEDLDGVAGAHDHGRGACGDALHDDVHMGAEGLDGVVDGDAGV